MKPDRAAITALLDEFIPAVVAQKDLKRGWQLVDGVAKTVSYKEWVKGNTSVQAYPAKGTHFPGWIVGYSYPGDVGFDILLQPTKKSLGPWSFRAEAQKIHGHWKITTWYPVATYAPAGPDADGAGPERPRPGQRRRGGEHPERPPLAVGARPAGRPARGDRARLHRLRRHALGAPAQPGARAPAARSRSSLEPVTLQGWRTTTTITTTASRPRPRSGRSPSPSR